MGRGRVYVIAEAATCHGGDEREAHRLVDAAKEAGCGAVKFQMIEPDELYAPYIQVDGVFHTNPVLASRERERLTTNAWKEIRAHCSDLDLDFSATVFGPRSLEQLMNLDPDFLKVASTDVDYHDLLRALGVTGLPVYLSTGMASLADVGQALEVLATSNSGNVCILHCVSVYPCPPELVNLPRMESLKRFGHPVGFSDHTLGVGAAAAAIAMGAVAVEKHMKLSTGPKTADSDHSLDEEALTTFVQAVNAASASLIDRGSEISQDEQTVALRARRGAYARRSLARKHVLHSSDITWVRPSTGLGPGRSEAIIGRRLERDLVAGEPIRETDVYP